jgi:hypothetical protein
VELQEEKATARGKSLQERHYTKGASARKTAGEREATEEIREESSVKAASVFLYPIYHRLL